MTCIMYVLVFTDRDPKGLYNHIIQGELRKKSFFALFNEYLIMSK